MIVRIWTGLVFKNHRSRWASAPRIVRKREQDFDPSAVPRMTIDSHSVNDRTELMPWPMPGLEVMLGEIEDFLYWPGFEAIDSCLYTRWFMKCTLS